MQDRLKDFTYEVTVSDELRELIHGQSGSKADRSRDSASEATSEPDGVFLKRRLRIDGRQPVEVMATELLTLTASGAVGEWEDTDAGREGGQSLSLLLTDTGLCLAHLILAPPNGAHSRPVYRLRWIDVGADVVSLVHSSQDDLEACVVFGTKTTGASAAGEPIKLLKERSAQMAETLAPFVKNSGN